MISSQIEKLAQEHAAALAQQGFTLRPGVGTPLAELVTFSSADGNAFNTPDLLSIQSNNPEHDQAMDAFAQFCADSASAHTNFARNVVSPALEAMQTKATDAIKALQQSPFMDYTIEEYTLPSLLKDENFQGLLHRFRTNTSVRPKLTLKYPEYPNERIIDLMTFNEESLDGKIKELLATLPDGQLQVIWQSVFQNQVTFRPSVEVKTIDELLGDYMYGGCSAVVIFILAYQLSREVSDDAGMDLVPAQELLNLYCQLAASSAFRQLDFDAINVSTKTLVRLYDAQAKKVVVNKQLLESWVSEGGKPEVLLGLMLMNQQPTTITNIAAQADNAQRAWQTHVQIKQSERDAVFDMQVRACMSTVFCESLENGIVDDAERDQLANGGVKALALKLFNDLLKGVTPSQLRDNFSDVFWRIACQARFHYTNAYQILSDVDYEVKVRGQDLDDALTIAQINYICSFVAEQIQVS